MAVVVRCIEESEVAAFLKATMDGFLVDLVPEAVSSFHTLEETSRTIAGFDGTEIVGTLGAFNLELAIPGGAPLATAGTTHITVRPTHRRRGLLRDLMRAHFEEIRERGDPLAALWSSESGIYRRFGYGPAADLLQLEVDPHYARFEPDVELRGQCRLVDSQEASTLLPEIYEGLWRDRPGCFARSREWWDLRPLLDAVWQREGLSANRFAIHEEAGEAKGYVQYRVREHWTSAGQPQAELRIVELQAAPAARAALWRLLLDVDLVGRVSYWNDAVDSELPWLLADPRRAERRTRDALWLRLVDLPRALEARSYTREERLVIGVRDAQFPENCGSFELDAGPAGTSCKRCSSSADFELDVSDLGSVYMGGHGLTKLLRAGRVSGDASAIARADGLFRTAVAPWCPEIF